MNESDSYIVGTCVKMCPPSEVELRRTNRLVHHYEKKFLVKEFSRSAADKKRPDPCNIRTFEALQNTLEYLFNTFPFAHTKIMRCRYEGEIMENSVSSSKNSSVPTNSAFKANKLHTSSSIQNTVEGEEVVRDAKILVDPEKPLNFRYDFIFDRCRAIRQEVVMQNFSCAKTLKLLEPIVMFLSFSMHRLNGSKLSAFDPKICLQHLQECLLRCLTCYDEIERLDKKSISSERRVVIEGIYFMLNMEDANALFRAIRLDAKLKSSFVIRQSIKICLSFHLKNFYKILKEQQELPHLICAIAALKLSRFRKEILHAFSIAYNSKNLSVPIAFLQRSLIYDEIKFLLRDLIDLGILDNSEENSTKVIFNRTKFDSSKSISNTSQQFVEEKLRDYHLPDLILLKTV